MILLRFSKIFHAALIIPLISNIFLINSSWADSRYPVVPTSEVDVPFCYMQTSDGRTIKLDALCGLKPGENRNEKPCNSKITARDFLITTINYSRDTLSGQVTNQTCKTVKSLKVNYEVLDESGTPIDNGFIDAQPSTVPPGGSASFRGTVSKGAKVQATHVDWSE